MGACCRSHHLCSACRACDVSNARNNATANGFVRPVRENAAKLIARFARDPPSMEVIRAHRGMEVLMELYAAGRLKV